MRMKRTESDQKHSAIQLSDSQAMKPVLFGQKLKEHRKKQTLSQQGLADMMKVTRNTIINWESDKSKPDYSLIPELCSLLGIQLYELFGMEPESGLSATEERVITNMRSLSPSNRRIVDKIVSTMLAEESMIREKELKQDFRLILVRPGNVAAGIGAFVPDDPPTYTFLRRNSISDQADGIVRVNGDSMEPVYHSGDYVYYKKTSSPLSGEDVIVDTDDGAVIKRVNHDMTLFSVNPNIPYPSKNESNMLIVRGLVLGTVQSSDHPSDEDEELLEELFVDEIREFRTMYGL